MRTLTAYRAVKTPSVIINPSDDAWELSLATGRKYG